MRRVFILAIMARGQTLVCIMLANILVLLANIIRAAVKKLLRHDQRKQINPFTAVKGLIQDIAPNKCYCCEELAKISSMIKDLVTKHYITASKVDKMYVYLNQGNH